MKNTENEYLQKQLHMPLINDIISKMSLQIYLV